MLKPSRRKCKVCNEWFIPQYDNIRWCSPAHGAIYAIELRTKEKVKAEAKRIKAQIESEKEGRKRRKERLAELRPAGYYKAQASRLSMLSSVRVMPIPHASVAELPILPISTEVSGTADTSKQSALTLNCALKNVTPISSANPAMPELASTPLKRRPSRSNTKLAWSLVTVRSTSTGSTALMR